ncbi:hypothetical protein BC826DRAFT_413366 [Russula brevipes]|nr:hypothetical protein BC826DRAFT_413366 [Russula brevipes]
MASAGFNLYPRAGVGGSPFRPNHHQSIQSLSLGAGFGFGGIGMSSESKSSPTRPTMDLPPPMHLIGGYRLDGMRLMPTLVRVGVGGSEKLGLEMGMRPTYECECEDGKGQEHASSQCTSAFAPSSLSSAFMLHQQQQEEARERSVNEVYAWFTFKFGSPASSSSDIRRSVSLGAILPLRVQAGRLSRSIILIGIRSRSRYSTSSQGRYPGRLITPNSIAITGSTIASRPKSATSVLSNPPTSPSLTKLHETITSPLSASWGSVYVSSPITQIQKTFTQLQDEAQPRL